MSEQRAWQGGGSDDRGIVRPSSTLGIVEKRTKSGVMSRPFSWAWLGHLNYIELTKLNNIEGPRKVQIHLVRSLI